MMKKIWTANQLKLLKEYDIPQVVYEEIEKVVRILDENYGVDRTETDDGGCVFLLVSSNEKECLTDYNLILKEYHLSTELAEFTDVLHEQSNLKWYLELYVLTEYGVTIIYCTN